MGLFCFVLFFIRTGQRDTSFIWTVSFLFTGRIHAWIGGLIKTIRKDVVSCGWERQLSVAVHCS